MVRHPPRSTRPDPLFPYPALVRSRGSFDFVELVGICDTNLEAARSMAARHSIPLVVADLAELLEQSRPDAVHVLTPPASHAAIALAAMEHGCHVLVEKP